MGTGNSFHGGFLFSCREVLPAQGSSFDPGGIRKVAKTGEDE
jgi:hypothetical protein